MIAADAESRQIRGKVRPRGVERAIATLAERQHGVVARRQLRALGFGDDAIDHRLRLGRLHRLHRGVYAVGYRRLSPRGRWMAAVLACGSRALLSHQSAAAHWGLRPHSGIPQVTVPGNGRHSRHGIRVHSLRALNPKDRAEQDGIPVTSVARTLFDLASELPPTQLHRAFEAAERLRIFDLREVERTIVENGGRSGIRVLRRMLAEGRPPQPAARSELESRFLDLCHESGIPPPAVNCLVAGFEVDAAWLRQRVIVELDGYAFHGSRAAFERDRRRDALLQVAGYRILRITHLRLTAERETVIAEIRQLLASPGI
jgi:hypothetical protein